MTPKVSIIVPCYNVDRYLERGIGCLSRQTLADIEIICINDGSTDETLRALETLALMDTRISIINCKENVGVSAARNLGIKQATGEYIGFMDPDDAIDYDFYQKLYDAAVKDNADMAIANLKCHVFYLKGKKHRQYREYIDVNPPWRNIDAIAKNLFRFAGHYAAIYGRRFIMENNLEYPDGFSNGEDHIFELKCILALHGGHGKYTVVLDTFYHHMRRLGSLDSHFFSTRQLTDNISAVKLEVELLNGAPGVSENDYNVFIVPRVSYLFIGLLDRITDQKSVELIAGGLIQIYKTLKYKEELEKFGDKILFALLVAGNREELAKYLTATTRSFIRTYQLFGFINIMTTVERHNNKTWLLFGHVPLWRVRF